MNATVLSRPLPFRMRPDLEVSQQAWRLGDVHVLKDPLTLRYYRLRAEEFALLELLDGRSSLQQIKERFEQKFAPHQLDVQRLQSLFRRFHRDGLLLVNNEGQGWRLWERAERQNRERFLSTISNVLAIRLRGVDPRWLLERVYPFAKVLLTPTAVISGLLVMIAAVLLLLSQIETVVERLPAQRAFFSATNIVWIGLTMAFAKVLHELGHALTLKRFGGDCHEIGLMFLVFTPCLYCNVTDAWTLPGKWRRIAVSAAGIYVELLLASVCVFLWWYTQPGLFNSLCFNLMVIGSVSSLVFNGNPLLRYDGYFVLSDLVEEPNLWATSRRCLQESFATRVLGLEAGEEQQLVSRRRYAFLLVYAVASMAYRVVVLVGILLLVHRVLESHRLQVVSSLLIGSVVLGVVFMTVRRVASAVGNPAWRNRVRTRNLAFAAAAVTLLLAVLVGSPLPYRVSAPIVLDLKAAQRVYVAAPATLKQAVRPGVRVAKGEPLAELQSHALDRDIAHLTAEKQQMLTRLEVLTTLIGEDEQAAAKLAIVRRDLESVSLRLSRRLDDRRSLTPQSLRDGVVFSPPVKRASTSAGSLPEWSGSPLEPRNLGARLQPQTLLCMVGEPDQWEALMYVDQADVALLRVGQRVRIRLEQAPREILSGVIEAIAKDDARLAPRELEGRQDVITSQDESGERTLVERPYQARIRVELGGYRPTLGATGVARVAVESRSLGWRLERYLRKTLRF